VKETLTQLTEITPEQKLALEKYEDEQRIIKQKGKKYTIAQLVLFAIIILTVIVWNPQTTSSLEVSLATGLVMLALLNFAVLVLRLRWVSYASGRSYDRAKIIHKHSSPEQKKLTYQLFAAILIPIFVLIITFVLFSYNNYQDTRNVERDFDQKILKERDRKK